MTSPPAQKGLANFAAKTAASPHGVRLAQLLHACAAAVSMMLRAPPAPCAPRRLRTHHATRCAALPPAASAPALLPRRTALLCGCAGCALLAARSASAAEQPLPGLSRFAWGREAEAVAMSAGMADYEAAIRPRKAALFAQLAGAADIAEVGLGAGPNLQFFPRSTRVVGVEPNEFMDAPATRAAEAAGVVLTVRRGVAEALPLEDASVDAVVATLVLCTVRDPAAALREIARVLRPGGRYVFIEHCAADAATAPLLALSQRALDPAQQVLAGGCHLTRDTGGLIRACSGAAGQQALPRLFQSLDIEAFDAPRAWPITPHVAGTARKAAV